MESGSERIAVSLVMLDPGFAALPDQLGLPRGTRLLNGLDKLRRDVMSVHIKIHLLVLPNP